MSDKYLLQLNVKPYKLALSANSKWKSFELKVTVISDVMPASLQSESNHFAKQKQHNLVLLNGTMQCVCVYVYVCLLSLGSIRVSFALRKWLINIYTEVEIHFEVPAHTKKTEGSNKSCKVTEKG